MNYLFLVKDEAKNVSNIYSIKAENRSEAENNITRKFMPYFDVTYDEMVSGLNDMEIYIEAIESDNIIDL